MNYSSEIGNGCDVWEQAFHHCCSDALVLQVGDV